MTKLLGTKLALSITAFAITLAAGAGSASAAGPGATMACTLVGVSADNSASPMRTTLSCLSDANLYSTGYGGTCPAISLELQKLWESMAMAALLSGKKLNIWWNDTCGSRAITSIQLAN